MPSVLSLLSSIPRVSRYSRYLRPRSQVRPGLWYFHTRGGRDASAVSNTSRLRRFGRIMAPAVLPRLYSSNFNLLGDNRRFHPLGRLRPLLVSRAGAAGWTAPSQPEWERQSEIIRRHAERAKRILEPGHSVFRRVGNVSDTLKSLRFSFPSKVVICAKRKIRREILHAMGIAGMVGFFNKPVRNISSQVRC